MATITFTDNMNAEGYVRITWTNAGISGNHQSYRLYRRMLGEDWVLLEQTTMVQANYTYDDWTAPMNVPVEYAVVEVTEANSVQTEEAKVPQTITAIGTDYWLIHPTNSELSVRLYHVTEDSFQDEYEEGTLNLLGHGRKIDTGTEFGVTGSLTAELRDVYNGPTGREQQIDLRTLKRTQSHVYLRNPFGDVWKIKIGNSGFDRMAGIGIRDFTSVTIPYSEVGVVEIPPSTGGGGGGDDGVIYYGGGY